MSILCHWVGDWRGRHLTQSGDRDDDRPRVFADYGYLSVDSTPLLVAKDKRTGMTFAAAVSMKRGGDPHAARCTFDCENGSMDWGCQEVTVRTDGEPSVCVNSSVVFDSSVRKKRPLWTRSVLQVTLQAMGNAERANLTVGGLVRTTKAVVEEKVLEGRNAGPRLTTWMVHHATQVVCACMAGADGAHAIQTIKWGASSARRWQVSVNSCGSKTPCWKRVNKLNPRCTEARLLGFCLKSSRYIVVDFDGRFRMVRTIKRANADDRWKVVSQNGSFLGR